MKTQSAAMALVTGTLVLLAAGCENAPIAGPTGPSLDASRARPSSPVMPERPFHMSGHARLVAQTFAPGFPGGRSDFDGRCSVPADFTLRFAMSAEATHLGHLTADFEHCTQIDFSTGAATLSDGIIIMTAANGDELHATYRTADQPEGAFDEAVVFDGGTGRFENASGEALGNAVCDRAAGTCEYEARGTLGYAASDQAGH